MSPPSPVLVRREAPGHRTGFPQGAERQNRLCSLPGQNWGKRLNLRGLSMVMRADWLGPHCLGGKAVLREGQGLLEPAWLLYVSEKEAPAVSLVSGVVEKD